MKRTGPAISSGLPTRRSGIAANTLAASPGTSSTGRAMSVSTHPGATRGNHYHARKIERFLVLQGEASIRLRRLLAAQIHEFRVTGAAPCYIDMPTFHTHDITNIGGDEMIVLLWANESFDPAHPDTVARGLDP